MYSYLVPLGVADDALRQYGVVLAVAVAWSVATVDRSFRGATGVHRAASWWPLPILLWGMAASVYLQGAFVVLAENYARALFFSLYLEAETAAVALALVVVLQLPGVLAFVRSGTASRGSFAPVVGVAFAVLAVAFDCLLSVGVGVMGLLDAAER